MDGRQAYRRVSSGGISRIQSPRRRPVNWPQRPGNPLDDVSFPARRGDRPCDIIMEGKGGAIRHVTDLALAPGAFITGQQPLGPLSSLVYTSPRGSKSLLTAALAWTLDDATTSLPHHVCTSAVSGAAGVGYHPILCHDSTSIQGRISIVCKAGCSASTGWWMDSVV